MLRSTSISFCSKPGVWPVAEEPMKVEDILSLDVWSLSARLRSRQVSSAEVVEAYLARISRLDGKVGAYISVTADRARADAAKADMEIARGGWRGPFHGVPIGLKDNLYTRGILTTGGSRVLADFRPDFDATVWARLASQGAILLGKLNLNEFAFGGLLKQCRNPYDLERLPGGSSAGAGAAVAARLSPAAIGTDTSGSIRIPAAQCGCVGLKATYGRISRHGVIPLSPTMDHVGPMTRTVRDAALILSVVSGFDSHDPTSSTEPKPDFTAGLEKEARGLRLGIIRELTNDLSGDVSRAFEAATAVFRDLGATVDEVSIPALEVGALINATVTWVEAFDYHERWLRERRSEYGKQTLSNLEVGMMVPAVYYFRAQRGRARLLAEMLKALEHHDLLISPGAATSAVRAREYAKLERKDAAALGYRDQLRFTQPFNATGQPALVLPTGLGSDAMPTSMQIIGRPFDESTLLRAAAAYEAARGPLAAPAI